MYVVGVRVGEFDSNVVFRAVPVVCMCELCVGKGVGVEKEKERGQRRRRA